MLHRIQTKTLVFVALGGGICTAAVGYYMQKQLVLKYAALSYYQDAVRTARKDEGVKYLMGVPLIDQVKQMLLQSVIVYVKCKPKCSTLFGAV